VGDCDLLIVAEQKLSGFPPLVLKSWTSHTKSLSFIKFTDGVFDLPEY
jgi:hypothetical protein